MTSAGKKSPHCGDLRDAAGSSAPAFLLQTFFAFVKALPCSKHLLFFFAQNRGKFAPNYLSLQLLHLLCKVAHRGTQGAKKGEPFWLAYSCVFLFYISYLIKSLLTDICSKHLLFTFAQNRCKFAPNYLSLQLLHLLYKVAHRGTQGAKKGEPFNGSSCHVVFCSVYSYSLLMKTTPNLMGFFQEILSFVFA